MTGRHRSRLGWVIVLGLTAIMVLSGTDLLGTTNPTASSGATERSNTPALSSYVNPPSSLVATSPSIPLGPSDAGGVFDTVVLNNGTVLPGNFLAVNALNPDYLLYDAAQNYIFLLSVEHAVDVLNPATGEFVTSIPLLNVPSGLVLDPVDHRLYVMAGNNLTVIDTTSLALVGYAPSGSAPVGGVYDPDNGRLYVVNQGSGNVTILDAATGASLGSFGVGTYPDSAVYDPNTNAILVSNGGSDNVTVYSPSSSMVTGQVRVGAYPEAIGYDGPAAVVAVANYESDNVTVVDSTSYGSPRSIPVGSLPYALNVSASGDIYVANEGSNTVSAIEGSDLGASPVTIHVGSYPEGATFDSANHEVYVPNYYTNNLSAIADPGRDLVASYQVGSTPGAVVYSSDHDEYFIGETNESGTSGLIVVNASTHAVTNEFSLPFAASYLLDVPSLNELWVSGVGTVGVIDESTLDVTLTHGFGGAGPLAYDSEDNGGEILLANSEGNVSVIDPTTDVGTTSIPMPLLYSTYKIAGQGMVWVGGTHDDLYITDGFTIGGGVSVVNASNETYVGQIGSGFDPEGITYDPVVGTDGTVYVTNEESDNLTTIAVPSTTTSSPGSPTGSGPLGITYDSGNGYLYVANSGSDNVSVIDPSAFTPLPSLAVGADPQGVAYASTEQNISVTNTVQGTLSLIGELGSTPAFTVTFATSPTTCTITFDGRVYSNGQSVGGVFGPYSIQADSCSGETFSSWSSSVGEVSLPGSASTSVQVTSNGTLTATYTVASYTVSFATSPTTCTITFNGVSYNNDDSTSVTAGSYNIQANDCSGETFSSWSSSVGNVQSPFDSPSTVAVNESGTLTAIYTATPVTVDFATSPTTCSITFNGVSYNNGGSTSVVPGTYKIAANACSGEMFSSWSSSVGTVTAPPSSATTVTVTTGGTLTANYVTAVYAVTFETSPADTCSITFDGTIYMDGQVDSNVAPGIYTINANACSGLEFVGWASTAGSTDSDLSTTKIDVTQTGIVLAYFQAPTTYLVTFTETGLPSGATWSVVVESSTVSSSSSTSLTISEPAGSFNVNFPYATYGLYVFFPNPTTSANFGGEPLGACSDPNCGTLQVQVTPVTVDIVYGSTWVTNWIPARDTYQFANPGSIYSPGGNCYGISETEVLYWLNEVDGDTGAPYLPIQAGGASDTAALIESNIWLRWENGGWAPNILNNATLAITIHQVADPDNSAGVVTLRSANFNQGFELDLLQHYVTSPGGAPTVIAMGDPVVGWSTAYHAVIVYGMTQYPNGTWEFDISDPNVPLVGTHAWYYPSDSSFVYNDGFHWTQFTPVIAHQLDASYLNANSVLNGDFLGTPPYVFALSDVAVTISSAPLRYNQITITPTDGFEDNDHGNSQTFYDGINGSVGIEEGSIQAYGIPGHTKFTIDPPATNSKELVTWSVNSSGTPLYYGFTVGTVAPGPGDYNLTPSSTGFNITAKESLTLANLSFFYGNGNASAIFNVYNLTLGAGATGAFAVTSWSGLNSTQLPSVTLQVYSNGSSSPSNTYHLVNGQDGLPASKAGSSTPFFLQWWFLAGMGGAALILILAVVAIRSRKDGSEPPVDEAAEVPK